MLVEIWMLKTILVISQRKIRKRLLGTKGKVILVKKLQRTWLDCVHVPVLYRK